MNNAYTLSLFSLYISRWQLAREGKVEFEPQIRSTIKDVIIIELSLELISIHILDLS